MKKGRKVLSFTTETSLSSDAVQRAKGSINLRVDDVTRQLIDEAAALLGKTRTEFILDCSRREAIDTILDQRLFTLDDGTFEEFSEALRGSGDAGPRLRSLMQTDPVWKR